ncbi:hypothetical protein J0H58_05170 [bacterium]|nr:hypothetical protein [bacterium]
MAVELRCPDCRAKLKLKSAPEPGSEVECPECYAVFDAPADAGTDEHAMPPARSKRPAADDDGEDRPRKKKPKEKKEKAGKDPQTPRKRKAKKKETNKALMTVLIVGGVMFLGVVLGMLWWFFKRQPPAYELMAHLPPDSTSVQGANIGHVRRYVEFYKKFEGQVNDTGFKKAGDAAAKAVGKAPEDFIDYMVTGTNSKGESALVLKASSEFDAGGLAKMNGARPGTADGRTYYTVDPIPGVLNGGRLKVFSPSKKLVVFVPESVSAGTCNRIVAGTPADDGVPGKFGALAKRTSRGTAWTLIALDASNKPKAPEKKEGAQNAEFEGLLAGSVGSAKAFGLKTSVGSRHVRFEAILQFGESDPARALRDKFRDSPLAKADDASLDPPRYWKQFVSSVVGNQKVGTELYSTLGATTSGDLFVLYAESETMTMMETAGSLVGKMTGTSSSGGFGGGGGGGGMPPPPGQGGPGGRVGGAEKGVAFRRRPVRPRGGVVSRISV